jgi:hypothetical protein
MAKAKTFGGNHAADQKVGANENQVVRNISYLICLSSRAPSYDACVQNMILSDS